MEVSFTGCLLYTPLPRSYLPLRQMPWEGIEPVAFLVFRVWILNSSCQSENYWVFQIFYLFSFSRPSHVVLRIPSFQWSADPCPTLGLVLASLFSVPTVFDIVDYLLNIGLPIRFMFCEKILSPDTWLLNERMINPGVAVFNRLYFF